MGTKIIRVQYEQGRSGLIFATSPDLNGLLVSERAMEAFDDSIPAAITDLYAACGVKVVVTKVDDAPDEGVTPWVAIRADIAQRALEQAAAH
jgi:hypothetical protein